MDPLHAGFDPDRGFLPTADPLRALPAAFAAWDETAAELPKLLAAGRARAAIASLPPLDAAGLTDEGERRRAMMLLSYFGHAYVWGADPPAARIPAPLAVPWHAVAETLGRPPVLSYASYALDNWRRLDPGGPIALGNIALIQNFLGGLDEEWFVLVHVEIEAEAAAALRPLVRAVEASEADDRGALESELSSLALAITTMHETLQRMPEGCDPYIYFHRVRPYIHGWSNHPALPDGVIYEGVDAYGGRPQRFRGETGAQSTIVPALDAGLGVLHANDELVGYLREMRDYMPPRDRAFRDALEARSRVRTVVEHAGSPSLQAAYDACMDALAAFRSTHLKYAGRYIHRQSQWQPGNPSAVGTGGTPFIPYLAKHRDETLSQRISSPSQATGT